MKLIVAALLAWAPFTALAEMDLDKAKAEMTANLDKRIASLQEAKSCISGATSKEDMKKCHHELKEDRQEMKKAHLEKREGRIKERMKKLEEQKAKTEGK